MDSKQNTGVRRVREIATIALPHTLTLDVNADPRIDGYARRGVWLTRDAASEAIAALRRDAYDLRTRPCEANLTAADEQDALALAIGKALL